MGIQAHLHAEGCRDIDQMPIAMENSTVTHHEGRRK
jgi:hypothetical protein